ncbi:MAG: substrate-binding domain-containing protein, partial [Spirochaetaceae bacterium]|nr:substrate-binding domain-containing protein [Spirochaetaceae bacterium]
ADIPAAGERLRGYMRALASRGIEFDPSLVATALDECPGGFEAASGLLGSASRPTALFCFNDRMAAGAVHAARRMGLSVPRDLSLVGFDNEELVATLTDPPLTTVQLPHYEMGRWAIEQLLELIAGRGDPPSQHRMPCPLVARGSVAAPGRALP